MFLAVFSSEENSTGRSMGYHKTQSLILIMIIGKSRNCFSQRRTRVDCGAQKNFNTCHRRQYLSSQSNRQVWNSVPQTFSTIVSSRIRQIAWLATRVLKNAWCAIGNLSIRSNNLPWFSIFSLLLWLLIALGVKTAASLKKQCKHKRRQQKAQKKVDENPIETLDCFPPNIDTKLVEDNDNFTPHLTPPPSLSRLDDFERKQMQKKKFQLVRKIVRKATKMPKLATFE